MPDGHSQIAQFGDHRVAIGGLEFAFEVFERKGDDVIVVDSRKVGFFRDIQPQAMEKIEVFGAELRHMCSEVVEPRVAIRRHQFKRQHRFRVGERFPGIAGEFALLIGGKFVRSTADDL